MFETGVVTAAEVVVADEDASGVVTAEVRLVLWLQQDFVPLAVLHLGAVSCASTATTAGVACSTFSVVATGVVVVVVVVDWAKEIVVPMAKIVIQANNCFIVEVFL